MDRISRLELFCRIVDGGSFARAAQELNVARSTATETVKQLERQTGVRLLARTTRRVSATAEGQEFHARARAILAEFDAALESFSNVRPRGHLRVNAPGILTRTFLVPRLPAFLEEYPDLTVSFGQTDSFINLVQEGVDCVLRVGQLDDSSFRLRKLGELQEITCASSGYLARRGTPRDIDDFEGHEVVGFVSSRTRQIMPLEFRRDGQLETRHVPARTMTDDADTAAAMAMWGLGLIQVPRYRFAAELASGALVEVLSDWPPNPMPLHAIHTADRVLSQRLAVFLDWVVKALADLP